MSLRDELAGKTTKLAEPREKLEDHPAALDNYEEGSFHKVPIEEINPSPHQPRQYFDEESLAELSQSIEDKGVLQPVIIRRDGDGSIYLVAGERRLRAAKQAGIEEIPTVLTKGNPAEIALIENIHREDLNPIDQAEAFARMIDEYQYTQEELAKELRKSQSTISETLSLNKLTEEIKEECRGKEPYPRRMLVEIAKQKTPKAMLSLFQKAKKAALTSDEVREMARSSRAKRSADEIVADRTMQLQNSLGKINLESLPEEDKVSLLAKLHQLRELINKLLDH